MDTEQKMTAQWLRARHKFDVAARDANLLHQAMDFVHNINRPVIVDLGSGTGNNIFSLLSYLPPCSNLVLVEQHADLLAISQNQISKHIPRDRLDTLSYVHCDIHQWLSEQGSADLLCTNALLDLFTATELKSMIEVASTLGTAIYSTLNYAGVTFIPSGSNDRNFTALFERHMCRSLDRGIPLGPSTKKVLVELLGDSLSSRFYCADSHWIIDSNEHEFLKQNLEFYRKGIETQLAESKDKERLDAWLNSKFNLIEQGKLTLIVKHWDYLILPKYTALP